MKGPNYDRICHRKALTALFLYILTKRRVHDEGSYSFTFL